MILSPEKKKKVPVEDSEEANYCYYSEDEETDAEELNQIISQLEESGIDLSALFDDS